jgi:hypothetical protein
MRWISGSPRKTLMEHLASHGYVIFSIAHPYQTSKVNLAKAWTIFRASDIPSDIKLPRAEMPIGIVSTVFNATNDIRKVSELKSLLLGMAEQYLALPDEDRADFLKRAVNSPELESFKAYISEDLPVDFYFYDYVRDNSLTQYWVETITPTYRLPLTFGITESKARPTWILPILCIYGRFLNM